MNIDISDNVADGITIKTLQDSYRMLKEIEKEQNKVPMYSYDDKEEAKAMKKLFKSFEKVLDYFGAEAPK